MVLLLRSPRCPAIAKPALNATPWRGSDLLSGLHLRALCDKYCWYCSGVIPGPVLGLPACPQARSWPSHAGPTARGGARVPGMVPGTLPLWGCSVGPSTPWVGF